MTRAPLWLARALAIAAAATAFGVLAESTSAQEPGSSELTFVVKTTSFENRLFKNCDLFFDNGSGTGGGVAAEDGPASGSVSLAQRSGEAYLKRRSWQVENYDRPPAARARPSTSFTDLGLAFQKHSVFLTGRIVRGPVLIAASQRVKLAVARGAKVTVEPLLDRRKHPVPDTIGLFASGKLTMLPAMARALEAQRCKDPHVTTTRHISPGYPIGQLTARLLPGSATGLAGEATMFVFAGPTGNSSDQVTVEASGGSTLKSEGHVVAPIATGAGVPLECIDGQDCMPSGGFGIGGGFDLVLRAGRASVANLVVAIAGDQATITGTVDGTPVTVAVGPLGSEPSFTSEFDQAAGAALGVGIEGGIEITDTTFTTLGPAG
jgi:hypothetical protein